ALMKELREWVGKELGPIAKPDDIRFADNLPKTRSGKIMRRLLKAIARGEEITQDVSTLENPATLDQLRGTEGAGVPRTAPRSAPRAAKKGRTVGKRAAGKRAGRAKRKRTAARKVARVAVARRTVQRVKRKAAATRRKAKRVRRRAPTRKR